MPTIDESAEQRDTFGNAPGWSSNAKAVEEPTPTAQPEASPAPDAEAAPSAAESSPEQVSQQAPAPTSQPEPEKKWNQPPEERWEELRQQRIQAESRAAKAEELAQLALQKLQPPQATQPVADFWSGRIDHPDAATARFWQTQKAMIDPLLQKVHGLEQAVIAGRGELAEVKVENFRMKNPTVTENSAVERAIAEFVQQGYDLNTAKKLAMFDTLEAENRALKTKSAAIPQKRAANTEASAGIPQTAGLPPKPGDWRHRAGEILDKGGTIQDVLSTVFGGGR